MAKIKSRLFIKKYTKSSKKRALRLIKKLKKVRLKRAFERELRFRGKKPQGLCALRLSALLTTLIEVLDAYS